MKMALAVVVVAVVALAGVLVPAARGVTDDRVLAEATADERAKDALAALEDAVDDRDLDALREAGRALDRVLDDCSDRVRRTAVRKVGAIFSAWKPRQDGTLGSVQDAEDAHALAVGLLFEREGGAEQLERALRLDHVAERPWVLAQVLEALGYAADPARVGLFAGYVDDDDPYVASAAARGLGRLHAAELVVRKDSVEAIVDAYATAVDRARRYRGERGELAQEYVDLVEVAFEEALGNLARADREGADAWEAWWREHRRDDAW